jgi:hypothetical protein
VGRAALADPGRPLEHVGVRDAAGPDCTVQRRPRQVLSDEIGEPHRETLTYARAALAARAQLGQCVTCPVDRGGPRG